MTREGSGAGACVRSAWRAFTTQGDVLRVSHSAQHNAARQPRGVHGWVTWVRWANLNGKFDIKDRAHGLGAQRGQVKVDSVLLIWMVITGTVTYWTSPFPFGSDPTNPTDYIIHQ